MLSIYESIRFFPRFYDRLSPLGGHPLLHHHHHLECGFVEGFVVDGGPNGSELLMKEIEEILYYLIWNIFH